MIKKLFTIFGLLFATISILWIIFSIADYFGIVDAQNKTHKVCADFKTWNAAQFDFKSGNKSLDRNHDGIACNALLELGK